MVIENEVSDLVVRGVSLTPVIRQPGPPPDTTLFSTSLKYPLLRSLEPQERPSHVPETRIRGSTFVQPPIHQEPQQLNEELDQAPEQPYDENTSAPQMERYLSGPDGERVSVEEVQGGKLTHSLWDGHRPIEEWVTKGSGRGAKDKGTFFTRDLGGGLLEMARYTRKLGRTAHELEDEDCDEDDDRDEWRRGGPEFKLGHVKFVSPDFMGSSALITNHKGRVLTRLTHGVWGEELEGNFNRVPFTFTGHRREARTGHLMALHRYLDPRAGRWSQRDPEEDIDGLNRYAYVNNAPLTAVDPLGLYNFDSGSFASGRFFGDPKKDDESRRSKLRERERLLRKRIEALGLARPCLFTEAAIRRMSVAIGNVTLKYGGNDRDLEPSTGAITDGGSPMGHPPGAGVVTRVGEAALKANVATLEAALFHELLHAIGASEAEAYSASAEVFTERLAPFPEKGIRRLKPPFGITGER